MRKIWGGLIVGLAIMLGTAVNPIYAASVRARVTKVIEEKMIPVMENKQLYQKLELEITGGSETGTKVVVENGDEPLANVIQYQVGDRVLIDNETNSQGQKIYTITDFERRDSLALLLLIFIVVTVMVARGRGIASIISMGLTFGLLLIWVLPRISAGDNPLLVASEASVVIIPITFYLSHGLNRKTTVAILGSVVSLIITGALAFIFIKIGHLTGLSSEEAGMLQINRGGTLNMPGLLLAGIVIGALGVLDDITISQAAIVDELSKTGKINKVGELYRRAMNVGKDHITSMVNTLVLAYAGVAMPLMLMFIDNPRPFGEVVNNEMIAEEIIRTMVGSIGLVIAVPITTMIAAYLTAGKKTK